MGLSGFRPVPGRCEGRNGMWKADCHTLPVHPWFHRQEARQVTIGRMILSYRAPTLCFSTSQTSLFTTSRRCFVSIHRGLIAGCLAAQELIQTVRELVVARGILEESRERDLHELPGQYGTKAESVGRIMPNTGEGLGLL